MQSSLLLTLLLFSFTASTCDPIPNVCRTSRFTSPTSNDCLEIRDSWFQQIHLHVLQQTSSGAVYASGISNALISGSSFYSCYIRGQLLSSTNENTIPSVGGALYLNSKQLSLMRSCGTKCFAYAGQFLYLTNTLSSTDAHSMNDLTLLSCGSRVSPDKAN
jgi:hypothetical protein